MKVFVATLAILLCGCGGIPVDPFFGAVYVQIKPGGTLDPSQVGLPNGVRIVFVNEDSVAHTVNWNPPLVLSGTAPAGDRVWFELPNGYEGTTFSYHLDANGATGTVTLIQPL